MDNTFPQPGGPQKISDGTFPDSSTVCNIEFFPITLSWPTYPLMVDGLISSARGAFSSLPLVHLMSWLDAALTASSRSPAPTEDLLMLPGSLLAFVGGGFAATMLPRWAEVCADASPKERSDCLEPELLLGLTEGDFLFLCSEEKRWKSCEMDGVLLEVAGDAGCGWKEVVDDELMVGVLPWSSLVLSTSCSVCNSFPPGRRQMSMWLFIASRETGLLQIGHDAVSLASDMTLSRYGVVSKCNKINVNDSIGNGRYFLATSASRCYAEKAVGRWKRAYMS